MLKATSLAKQFDGDVLFSDVNLVVGPGDRIGLVGPNGAGKSTLLRVLTGAERPSSGQVTYAPNASLGYLAQQVPDADATVGRFLAEGLGEVDQVGTRLANLQTSMAHGPVGAEVLGAYGDAQDRWAALGGWMASTRVAQVRQRLDIAHLPDDARLAEVSGGEQARLMLARVLLAEPSILLLDEPTNHLDADGIAWLGQWLARFTGGLIVVSHDRQFLDQAVNQVIELDGIHETPQLYSGGYTAYWIEKGRRWQRLLTDFEAQEKDRRRWEADIERTKEQARGVELTAVKRGRDQANRYAKKVAKKAKARERRLRRQMAAQRWLAEPQTRPVLALAFPDEAAPDETVLEVSGLAVKLGGRSVLRDVDLTVRGGDRILISGRNGAGKTTLLRVLAGALSPDDGRVTGRGLLLPQTHDALRTSMTVLDFFRSRVPVYAEDAEQLLEGYLFDEDQWRAPLRTLSSGELRRLLLAVMVNSSARVLLLDEPTNYLDFDALSVVESALRTYRGTILTVTHDRYFATEVAHTRAWRVEDGNVRED
jgi:ATPase subunit of ABC transporter with duplicated ATPase domains